MRRIRRLPNLVTETDNLVLLLVGIGIGLLLTTFFFPVVMPRLAPFLTTGGVSCTRLSEPRGGNSRSLLAIAGDDAQNLEVELMVRDTALVQGEPLEVDVIMKNEDIGPIVLFMPEIDDLVLNSPATVGITLEIRDILTNNVIIYGIPGTSIPQEATFRDSEIHLLAAKNRCRQSFTIELPLGPGEYSVIARYSNDRPGVRSNRPNETPDPNFPTQGVWTNPVGVTEINSPELRFTILPPPAPTIPPAPAQ